MAGERRTELHARLLALFETFRAAAHVRCDVTLEASHTRFGEEASEIVYDTIRELLLNVHKHAKATRVEISSVKRRDGSIGIIVADNGVGLPAHRRRGRPLHEAGGSGLWSIDRRLRELDAMLDIEAAEGQGTRAMVIIPGHLLAGD